MTIHPIRRNLLTTPAQLVDALEIPFSDEQLEAITAPLRGLALGIFLITVGMRLDIAALLADWPALLGATLLVLIAKSLIVYGLLRWRGSRTGTALETSFLMASPSELTLIVLASALAAGLLGAETVAFWTLVTAIGLTLTPLLAALGRRMARRSSAF